MVLGLKSGTVELFGHDPEWGANAADTIKKLRDIFGPVVKDIQHVGSTSIRHIKAKPVIDIAVSAWNFEDVLALTPVLEENGFIFRGWEGEEDRQPRFQCGKYNAENDAMHTLTHYIHIVMANSQNWHNYINFRDYMNAFPSAAFKYEALKLRLAKEIKDDGNYLNYHPGKQSYVKEMIETANLWDRSGRNVR